MFFSVLTTITVPLMAVIALGYLGARRFDVDPRVLGRLLINIVAPGAFVYFLVSDPAPMSAVSFVSVYTVVRFAVLYLLGLAVLSLVEMNPVMRRACALAVAFPNSGNYGIPLVQLAFGDAFLFHQSVITSIHSILIVVLVPLLLPAGRLGLGASLVSAFRTPLLPAVMAGVAIKSAGIELPQVVTAPLGVLAAGLTPLALLTLGAQVATVPRVPNVATVGTVVLLRLLAAPLLTAASFLFLAAEVPVRDFLVVNACVPVGVILAVLLAEHRQVSAVVTTTVAASTALAPLAVAVVLALL